MLQISQQIRFFDVFQFLEFMEKYPNCKPRTISFYGLDDVLITHKRNPALLQVAEIDVRWVADYNFPEEVLNLGYNFHRIEFFDDSHLRIPETVRELTVRSVYPLGGITSYSHYIQNLRLENSTSITQLKHIPSNLLSLHIQFCLQ